MDEGNEWEIWQMWETNIEDEGNEWVGDLAVVGD